MCWHYPKAIVVEGKICGEPRLSLSLCLYIWKKMKKRVQLAWFQKPGWKLEKETELISCVRKFIHYWNIFDLFVFEPSQGCLGRFGMLRSVADAADLFLGIKWHQYYFHPSLHLVKIRRNQETLVIDTDDIHLRLFPISSHVSFGSNMVKPHFQKTQPQGGNY